MIIKLYCICAALCSSAVDLRRGKVPNILTAGICAGGIILRLLTGERLSWMSLYGFLLPALLLFPLFCLHMLGAGDIKLLCAFGLTLEEKILPCMVWSFVTGALISVLVFLRHRRLFTARLLYLRSYLRILRDSPGHPPSYRRGGLEKLENFPFTIAVLGSILLYAGGVY